MTEVRKLMKSKPSGQICLKVGLNQLPKRDESPLPAERAQGAPSSQSHTSRWWQRSAGPAPCIRMRHVSAGCPYGLQGIKKAPSKQGKIVILESWKDFCMGNVQGEHPCECVHVCVPAHISACESHGSGAAHPPSAGFWPLPPGTITDLCALFRARN